MLSNPNASIIKKTGEEDTHIPPLQSEHFNFKRLFNVVFSSPGDTK